MIAERSGPTGRDEVVDALVEHATRLFSQRGLDQISVREIAAAAGVNHALVFRHFGSKIGLMQAVLDRLRDRFAAAAARGEPRSAISDDTRLYAVILARILLDGPAEVIESGWRHPVVDWLRGVAAESSLSEERASQLAASVLALELGWQLYLPAIIAATGISAERAPALLTDTATTVMTALTEQWSSETPIVDAGPARRRRQRS